MKTIGTGAAIVAALLVSSVGARAQVIGSYDNFDCFNDTGETAEGFEIDIQDVKKVDLTREFPSNFSTTPWVIRYGLPKVTSYNFTVATPDAPHAYDAGHKGVLVTWAATWNGTKWVAAFGNQPFGASQVAGDGTPYVAHPTLTNGDSCWYYGLGQAYPSSGCDHFGISLAPTAKPGLITYHWKLPDAANPGHLANGATEASIPPSPTLYYGGVGPVNAVAEGPEHEPNEALNRDQQFGTAYWVKVTTFVAPKRARLDFLQKKQVAQAKQPKTVTWGLLQRAPRILLAGEVEHEEVENDLVPDVDVQVTKQYEYFKFAGAYDSENHERLCNPAVNCKKPTTASYTITLKKHGGTTVIPVDGGDLGDYLGAHINARNIR